jgi:hypothetical protein
MSKVLFGLHAIALMTLVTFFPAILSAAEMTDTRDIGAQSCKEVMRLSGEERDLAIAFAHGYMLGKKGTTKFEVEALAQVTDQFIDYCLDHPAENALASFEKFAK